MKTPNKPLFIIDTSQTHGRGEETQWVSCTSGSCPFVASVVVIDEQEFARHYDPQDVLTAYSDASNGMRLMAHVTNIAPDYNPAQARTLLRKLIKELMTRRRIVEYDPEDPSDEAVLKFIEVLQGQNRENLRTDPTNPTHRMVFSLLRKLHRDYEQPSQE
mgnify:CR=1 FL=1